MGEIIKKDIKHNIQQVTMEENNKEKSANHVYDTEVISFDIAIRNRYELDLKDKFHVVLREGKYYVERIKPQYPKTYEECCKIGCVESISLEKLKILRQLIYCRNIYWMIAGAQMELPTDWKPDWRDFSTQKYSISVDRGEIITSHRVTGSRLLVFPTEEMRDAFRENFKDLIDECKELL